MRGHVTFDNSIAFAQQLDMASSIYRCSWWDLLRRRALRACAIKNQRIRSISTTQRRSLTMEETLRSGRLGGASFCCGRRTLEREWFSSFLRLPARWVAVVAQRRLRLDGGHEVTLAWGDDGTKAISKRRTKTKSRLAVL